MGSALYHLPVLSVWDFGFLRSPGPGLGNLLFPIARALAGQARYGGVFVYPTMRQMKVGPLLRWEHDLRIYGGEFRGRTIGEWRDWFAACQRPKVPEGTENVPSSGRIAITYSGLGRYFHDIADDREPVATWINANANRRGAVEVDYDVGIHIRLGDFKPIGSGGVGHSVRLSFDWYRDAFAQAAEVLGHVPRRTILFTDEDPCATAESLGIPGLEFDQSRNAITAIINLSRARVVITSRSTFSMWAVYLGGSAAIWNAQMDLTASFPRRPGLDLTL